MKSTIGLCLSALSLALLVLGCSSDDGSSSSNEGTPTAPGERHPIGKADATGSCASEDTDHCGGKSDGTCWCDAECEQIGDCCADRAAVCGESCTATFRWLQKDAYKEGAGRSAEFWPPHTTTVMTVTCEGQVVAEAVMKNHGTGLEAVDAEGTPILVEVRSQQASGDRAALESLATQLQDCECGTTFLSLDALGAPAVEELLGELSVYMEANLTCPFEGGVGALIQSLTDNKVDEFLKKAPSCSWTSGASWTEGLSEALTYFAAQSSQKLSDYHVCNNDAQIQTEMWASFVATGNISACNSTSPLCAGPKWLYTP